MPRNFLLRDDIGVLAGVAVTAGVVVATGARDFGADFVLAAAGLALAFVGACRGLAAAG